MKNRPFRHAQEDVDYWRSMLDVVLGLLLIVLLAMSLLLLGFMDRPLLGDGVGEYTAVEPSPTVSPTPTISPTPSLTLSPTPTPTPTPRWHDDGGGGGGTGVRYTPTPTPTPTPTLLPTATVWFESDKSAVQVIVRDGETQKILPIAGISFEVLDSAGSQQSYNVYYPERKKYNRYETTLTGRFYLPEKLPPDVYTLKNLSAPEDYDLAENTEFEVVLDHDWDDPILVNAFLFPCKNTISISVSDAESGAPVAGGQYTVVAMDDVITSDGTVRYRAGDAVATVACDENGRAVTDELYLGTFALAQKEIPFGYARADLGQPIELGKRPTEHSRSFFLQRTTMVICVRDEVRLTRVPGMSFVLTGRGGQKVDLVADANGEIRLTDLEKNTDYLFVMKEKTGGYLMDDTVYSFSVDADGLIAGAARAEMTVSARRLNCSFGAASAVLSLPVAGQNVALFAADGTLLQQWYSTETPLQIEDLEPGQYVLAMNGERTAITIENTAAAQVFYARIWQPVDWIALAAGAILVIALSATLIAVLVRKRKTRK